MFNVMKVIRVAPNARVKISQNHFSSSLHFLHKTRNTALINDRKAELRQKKNDDQRRQSERTERILRRRVGRMGRRRQLYRLRATGGYDFDEGTKRVDSPSSTFKWRRMGHDDDDDFGGGCDDDRNNCHGNNNNNNIYNDDD